MMAPFEAAYDVIVVGGGHAGCEAALLVARSGLRVCILTLNAESIAQMPCNPSIGGPGKGHLVREIDALGGEMARNTDETYLQVRYLNTRKGPSARALRAQSDKIEYSKAMTRKVRAATGLTLAEEGAADLILDGSRIRGVTTLAGRRLGCQALIITSGTFLNGRIHIGDRSYPAGRHGEAPSVDLSQALVRLGFQMQRLKTGTPPRVHRDSIDFGAMQVQEGIEPQPKFSYLSRPSSRPQYPCHLIHTTAETKRIVVESLARSPLYSGAIEGIGPRYCPSIEDKFVKFPDRESHQIYIEPESLGSNQLYVQGFSTCMPEEVQLEMLRSLPGLEDVRMLRPGYAVEYDALNPIQLEPTLESRTVKGLYFAGQVNGTSGYEEAAGQAMVAAINAVAGLMGRPPVVLGRDEAYIGVMVDDLTSKGVTEPYRVFTSRSEYRLLLRHDNADRRLTHRVRDMPHLGGERRRLLDSKKRLILEQLEKLQQALLPPSESVNQILKSRGSAPLAVRRSASELLRRPELDYQALIEMGYCVDPTLPIEVMEEVTLEVKYAGYIRKQTRHLEEFQRLEQLSLPVDMDYTKISAMSHEARVKLQELRPRSVGQASRITGVRMSDVSLLIGWVRRHARDVIARQQSSTE